MSPPPQNFGKSRMQEKPFTTFLSILYIFYFSLISFRNKYNVGDSVRYTPYSERNVDTWC